MRPVLVVVSGFPAAGKTTLSSRLAADLKMVLVSRDQLRRPFLEAWSALPPDRRGPLIGAAVDQLLNGVLGAVLASGTGAVVDGNFNWVFQADALRAFVHEHGPSCYEVCLWGDAATLRRRFVERNDQRARERARVRPHPSAAPGPRSPDTDCGVRHDRPRCPRRRLTRAHRRYRAAPPPLNARRKRHDARWALPRRRDG